MLKFKDYVIGILAILLVVGAFVHTQVVRAKNNDILDLRVDIQNTAVELGQTKTELDSSQTALTAVRDLNRRKDEEIRRLNRDLGDVRTVLARMIVEIDGLRVELENVPTEPAPQDTTRRTFSVRQYHLYADGDFGVIPPYSINIILGSDPIRFQGTLFVTDDKRLAFNYKLHGDGPSFSHVFTEVDRALFEALFSETVDVSPIAQISWFKRLLSKLELGLGVGAWYGPDLSIPVSVEVKYGQFAVEAIGTLSGHHGFMGKYYLKPF